jgi:hypothetical protein
MVQRSRGVLGVCERSGASPTVHVVLWVRAANDHDLRECAETDVGDERVRDRVGERLDRGLV